MVLSDKRFTVKDYSGLVKLSMLMVSLDVDQSIYYM